MTDWEFLIQREGDRGWRTIKTGNLQLPEGKYRIVASSNLLDTQIQTRVTYQTLGLPVPQRRSRSCNQTTNPRGLLVIIPFTYLQLGMWQFVCSCEAQTPWHRILKLRVLAKTPSPSSSRSNRSLPVEPPARLDLHRSPTQPAPARNVKISQPQGDRIEDSSELPTPTEPLVPLAQAIDCEDWANGLDRLLAQIELDSLQVPPPPIPSQALPGTIQINAIVDPPSQLVSLDRATFSGIVPGHRPLVSGGCNLQILKTSQIPTAKVEKISICLRHPQTSEIIVSIEQPIPPNLDIFAFSGRLEIPTEPKVALLLGEVNLYDKHHIQIGSSGFTIALNLNPFHDSELSLLRQFDRDRDPKTVLGAADEIHHQSSQELELEIATIVPQGRIGTWHLDSAGANPSGENVAHSTTIRAASPPSDPAVPLADRRESSLRSLSELFEPGSIAGNVPFPDVNATHTYPPIDELDLDITDGFVASSQRPAIDRRYPNLEIVIDD